MSVTLALCAVLIGLLTPYATAQGKPERRGLGYELGLGVALHPEFEGSTDYEVSPFPYFRWQGQYRFVVLEGSTLTANLLPSRTWMAGPLLHYGSSRSDVRNPVVDRLRDVDTAFEIGGFVGVRIAEFSSSVRLQQDVLGGHDGMLLTLAARYGMPFMERWKLEFGASGTYASDDYMQSYFGIDADNALRSGLPTFQASAGFKDVGVHLALHYNWSRHWGFTGGTRYKRLLGDAADSPIVKQEGSAHQPLAFLMVLFRY
jgi:outer membrane protein